MISKLLSLMLQRKKLDIIILVLVAAVLLFTYFVQPVKLNTFELGVYLNAGKRLMSGQMLYKDFHHHYGPLNAWKAMVLLQSGLDIHQISRIFFFHPMIEFAIAILLYLHHRREAVIPGLLLLLAAFSYATGPSSFIVLYAAFVAIRTCQNRLALFSGILSTGGLWWFHDVFVYIQITLAIGFIVMLLFRKKYLTPTRIPAVKAMLLGVFLGLIVFFVFIIATSDVRWYFFRCWWFTVRYYDSFAFGDISSVFELSKPTIHSQLLDSFPILIAKWFMTKFLFLLPPLAVLLHLTVSFASRSRYKIVFENIVCIYCILLYRQVIKTGGDPSKLQFTLFPTIILTLNLYRNSVQRSKKWLLALAFGLITTVTAYTYIRQVVLGVSQHSSAKLVDIKYGGSGQYELITYVNGRKDFRDHFVVFPNNPMLYLQCNSTNPIPYDYIDPIVCSAFDNDISNVLVKPNVRYVFINTDVTYWNKWKYGENFGSRSFKAILEHFEPVQQVGSMTVYKRRH